MKTTLERLIWPPHIAAATGSQAIILRQGKLPPAESVHATWCGGWTSNVAVVDGSSPVAG
jgi:hypothetical protein